MPLLLNPFTVIGWEVLKMNWMKGNQNGHDLIDR